MKFCSPGRTLLVSFLIFLVPCACAQDASIDQLLKKLPPPEKFALPHAERALQKTDPAAKDPLAKEMGTALRMRDFSRAENLSAQLIKRYPQSVGAYCMHATIEMDLRRYANAVADLRKAIDLQPKLALSYFLLGNAEAMQQHFATALQHFRKAAELEPKNAAAWAFLSACAERAGRKQESLDSAKRATTVSPAFLGGWFQLARAEKALGHTNETLSALTRAAEISPDNVYLLAVVGFSYINLNRIPQAVPLLQHAAQMQPTNFLVQSQLGYCLATIGQVDAGIAHLKKGASLNSKYGPVWGAPRFGLPKTRPASRRSKGVRPRHPHYADLSSFMAASRGRVSRLGTECGRGARGGAGAFVTRDSECGLQAKENLTS